MKSGNSETPNAGIEAATPDPVLASNAIPPIMIPYAAVLIVLMDAYRCFVIINTIKIQSDRALIPINDLLVRNAMRSLEVYYPLAHKWSVRRPTEEMPMSFDALLNLNDWVYGLRISPLKPYGNTRSRMSA